MEWKVRYIDYARHYGKLREKILATVDDVLSRGDVMLRGQLRDFEEHLAAFCGTRHAVGVSNCTDGLHLTLRAAGIGAGDEVITVSHTFIATAAAIHHAGAQPVLVDITDDHLMDVDQLEAAITPRTRAIMPVQLNGRLCRMDRISEIAEKHGLAIIEDTAQALGGSYQGIRGGNWGLAGAFSFYPAKLLGAYGDAGAVVTSSDEIADRLRKYRDHGRCPDGEVAFWSFNARLDNLHAALLDLRLAQVMDYITRRREIAAIYHELLQGIPQLLLPPPPTTDGPHFDAFQNYEIEAENRSGLKSFLAENGIETMITWGGRGIHQFKNLGLTHFRLPRTERMFERVLMLPMHCELEDEQVRYVAEQVRRFYS